MSRVRGSEEVDIGKRFRGLTLLRNPEWLLCGWCRDCWVWAYEGMFLLDSTKAAAAWDDTIKHVHDILTKHNSEIVASRKKATYLLTYFKTDGTKLKDIVADCHLSDLILRELILKVHPKLEVQLVNQAMTSTPNAEAKEASGYDDELDERPAGAAATSDRASSLSGFAGSRLIPGKILSCSLQAREQPFTLWSRD